MDRANGRTVAGIARRMWPVEFCLQAVPPPLGIMLCMTLSGNGWVKADVFYWLFRALATDADFEYTMIDGTIMKVHRSGQSAKGGLKARL